MDGSEMSENEGLKIDRITHWDNVYKTKQTNEVSWFEAEPTTSLDLIESADPVGGRIIDVGGGASFLVDRLVAKDKWDVTVLDISSAAIEHARNRLGETGRRVKWICADIVRQRNWKHTTSGMIGPSFTFLPVPKIDKLISIA